MKKIHFLLFLILGGSGGGLVSQEVLFKKLPSAGFLEPQVWGKNSDYNFSLLNRSGMPLWIQLKNGGVVLIPLYRLMPSNPNQLQGVMAGIDLKLPTVLTIQSKDDEGEPKSYSFVKGKTIYVTWTKEGGLRPQIGQFYGLVPYSRAGFELNMNVQPGDIKEFK